MTNEEMIEKITKLEQQVKDLERKMDHVWIDPDLYIVGPNNVIMDRETGVRVGYR